MRRTTRRRRRHHGVRHLVRNMFGADLVKDVLVPVAGGAVGFLFVRALGNYAAQKNLPIVGTDPRAAKLAAAVLAIPGIFWLSKKYPMIRENAGALVLGIGLAPAEAYLRTQSWYGPSMMASVPAPSTPAAPAATGDYYSTLGTMYATAGADLGVDISHAGAPYKGMLGLGDDPSNQAHVDTAMDAMESGKHGGMLSVSTVTPTDVALQAQVRPQIAPVDEPFADGDRGGAGGLFARHLFAGMTGA